MGLGLDRVRLDRGGGQQRQRALCTPARLRRRVEPDEQIAVELEPALRQGARPDALVRVGLRVSGLGLA